MRMFLIEFLRGVGYCLSMIRSAFQRAKIQGLGEFESKISIFYLFKHTFELLINRQKHSNQAKY